MTPRFAVPLLAGLAACSSLTETAGGVGGLTVLAPSPAELEVGQTIQLQAVAVDGNQDTVDVPIVWLALDTTLTVDSLTGMVTGRTAGQTGRVVARAADLYSAEVRFSILRRVDTLVRVSADTQSVVPPATFSSGLIVRLSGGDPPTPVAGRRVIFRIVWPEFAAAADRTVEFPGGVLLTSSLTGSTGEPPAVRIQVRDGTAPPDSAIVEASAYRPAGGPAVPGSGARFIVRFRTP